LHTEKNLFSQNLVFPKFFHLLSLKILTGIFLLFTSSHLNSLNFASNQLVNQYIIKHKSTVIKRDKGLSLKVEMTEPLSPHFLLNRLNLEKTANNFSSSYYSINN